MNLARQFAKILAATSCVALCLLALPAFAQAVRQVEVQAWQPQPNPMGTSLQWTSGPQMEKELDIVPDQKEALTKLRTETHNKIRTLYDMSIADPQERMQKYNAAAKALGEETEKKVQDILLPHQIRRLKQIAVQMQLQSAGYGGGGLQNGQLADELKITDEQRALLQEKQKEVMKELQEKILAYNRQLQEEAREKLLSVLTPVQRRKLEELTGEKFQWQPNPAVREGAKQEQLK